MRRLRLLALGVVAGSLALGLADAGQRSNAVAERSASSAWLASAVGRPTAPTPVERRIDARTHVRLGGAGIAVRAGRTRAELAAQGVGAAGRWQAHANGVTRSTSFGHETIVVGRGFAEDFLTIARRQGTRTWSWRIGGNVTPAFAGRGVVLLRGARNLAVLPVRIYDARHRDVTPHGVRWSLARSGGTSLLQLKLNDAHLSVPYVIDPLLAPEPVSYRGAVSTNNPSHWWHLDETSGTSAADSAGVQTGTYTFDAGGAAPTLGLAPLMLDSGGHSIQLDSANKNYVSLGTMTTPATIEAWVQIPAMPGGVAYNIWSNRDGAGHGYDFGVYQGVLFGSGSGGAGFFQPGPRIDDGQPHYVAVTLSGAGASIYLDGNLLNGVPGPAIAAASAPAYIGWDAELPTHYFQGRIDEVATYGAVLSDTQIMSHYLAGVDNTPPTLTINAASPPDGAATQQTTAHFDFAATDATSVTCTFDGNPVGGDPCASPEDFTGLAEGAHHFAISAVDAAGNRQRYTDDWTVDTTAPTGTFDAPTPGLYKDPVSISVTATDAVSGVASVHLLDGSTDVLALAGAGNTWTGSWSGGADGDHSLSALITDRAGNTFQTTATTITLDNTGPAITLTPSTGAVTSSTGETFTFSATDTHPPATFAFQCKLDTAAFAACTSPQALTGLADGPHTFAVQTSDALGNTSQQTFSWTIDRTPPAGTLTAPSVAKSPVSVSVDASDNVGVAGVQLLEGATTVATLARTSGTATNGTWTGSWTTSVEGSHDLHAVVTDLAGNTFATTLVTVVVDNTPPALSITSGPADGSGTNATDATFTYTAVDAHGPIGITCVLDSVTQSSCASPITFTGLAEGLHLFTITATDVVGNAVTRTIGWRIDTHPPTGTVISPTSGDVLSSPIEFDVSAADNSGVASVAVLEGGTTRAVLHLASGSLASGIWTGGWSTNVSGTHTLSVVVTDLGGNAISLPVVVIVPAAAAVLEGPDLTPPSAPHNFHGNVHSDGLVLYWDPATDVGSGVAHYFLWINGQLAQTFGFTEFQAGPFGDFSSTDTRVFQVDANDAADNVGPFSPALTGVPLVTGSSLDDAKSSLLARGFNVGTVTEAASPVQPGMVIAQSPSSPSVAPVGSAVDLVVSKQGGQAALVMNVAAAHRILLSQRNFIAVRVELSLPSSVTSTLYDPRGRRIARWHRDGVEAGATILQLTLPKAVTRTGVYRLVVRADAAGQTVTRAIRITLVGRTTAKVGPVKKHPNSRLEVALVNGPDIRSALSMDLDHRLRFLYVQGTKVFGVAAAPASNVGVAVIDLDGAGSDIVHDLKLVFPELRVIAIASSASQAAQARAAGASIVFTKPVSPAVLAAAIRALIT